MPAKDVKAHVGRNKNDVADAEAICEAVSCPTMRFVRVKSAAAGQLMQISNRRSADAATDPVINALQAHMAELGIVAAQGREGTVPATGLRVGVSRRHQVHAMTN